MQRVHDAIMAVGGQVFFKAARDALRLLQEVEELVRERADLGGGFER
jgi:hypothetical protein